MNKVTVMKDNDACGNSDVLAQDSEVCVGIIHKRLQMFEKKCEQNQTMTLKPPIKPKPRLDSMNRPKVKRESLQNNVKPELEKKLKQSVLELQLHTNDRPKTMKKPVVTTNSFTVNQNRSSNNSKTLPKVDTNKRVVANDSFLAALTSKMVIKNDSFTSYSEDYDTVCAVNDTVCGLSENVSSTNEAVGNKSSQNANNSRTSHPEEAVSFLYKRLGSQSSTYDEAYKKSLINEEEPEEESEYDFISETDNYIVTQPRTNAGAGIDPFDMNNNGENNKSNERLFENSSPIYNEIDDDHIYQVIGFHIPDEHKKCEDDFGWTNLRDSNKSISAVNEYCKRTETDSMRHIEGSPISLLEKYKRTLRDLAKELIDTEEKYVNCLSHVVRDYLPELRRPDAPKSLLKEKYTVFSNIHLLHKFHEGELLPSLRAAGYDFASLGKTFTDNEDSFKLYVEYYINKSNICELLPEYKAFFTEKQILVGEKHALSTFLLEPIQRMPRYEMLLGQLVNTYRKYYQEVSTQDDTYVRLSPVSSNSSLGSEPELVFGCLNDAYAMIKKILKTVNDRISLDNIEECHINLKEQGYLILQNEFTVIDSSKRRLQLRCFLFEKLLLLCTICRLQPKKEKYTYHDAIFMTDLGLTPPEDNKSDKFTIWYKKRTQNPYIIESRGEMLSSWVKEISEVLWKQAERDKERLMSKKAQQSMKVIQSTVAPCNMPVFLYAEPETPETVAPVDKCMSKGRKKRKQEVRHFVEFLVKSEKVRKKQGGRHGTLKTKQIVD